MNDIRKRVQALAIDQERLAQSRNELLSKREHIRLLVKDVQVKRVEAGDAEVAFMTYVRKIATNGLINISSQEQNATLSGLYNRVELVRDKVGELETDLLHFGRDLTAAEIRFQEEENSFYQYDLVERFEDDFHMVGPSFAATSPLPTISLLPPPHPPSFPPPPPPPLQSRSSESSPWPYLAPLHLNGQVYYPLPPPPPQPPPPQQAAKMNAGHVPKPVRITMPALYPSTGLFERIQNEKRQQHDSTELDGMGKQFNPIHCAEDTPLDTRDEEMQISTVPTWLRAIGPYRIDASTSSAPHTRSSLGSSDVETDQTHVEDTNMDFFASVGGRRRSDPNNNDKNSLSVQNAMERSLSESAILSFQTKPTPKHRIRVWLLDLLEQSKIEKKLYQNILEDTLELHGFDFPDNESWEEPARTLWSYDSRSSLEEAISQSDSRSLESEISPQTSENTQAVTGAFRRRRSTRANLADKPFDSKVHHPSTVLPWDDDLDDPSFFPLPQSTFRRTSLAGSEDSSMDDPCYFPLPPSIATTTDTESPENPLQSKESLPASRPSSTVAMLPDPRLLIQESDVGTETHNTAHLTTPSTTIIISVGDKTEI